MLTNAIWRYTVSPARASVLSWSSCSIGCNVCTGSLVGDSGTGAAVGTAGEAGVERGLGDLGSGLYVSMSPPVVSGDRSRVAMLVRLKCIFVSPPDAGIGLGDSGSATEEGSHERGLYRSVVRTHSYSIRTMMTCRG